MELLVSVLRSQIPSRRVIIHRDRIDCSAFGYSKDILCDSSSSTLSFDVHACKHYNLHHCGFSSSQIPTVNVQYAIFFLYDCDICGRRQTKQLEWFTVALMADNSTGFVHHRRDGEHRTGMKGCHALNLEMSNSMMTKLQQLEALNLESTVGDDVYRNRVRATESRKDLKKSWELLKNRQPQKTQHGHRPQPETLDASSKQSLDLIEAREPQKPQQRRQQTSEALGCWPASPPRLSAPPGTSVEAARTLTKKPQAHAAACLEEARKLSEDTDDTSSSESMQDDVARTDERTETRSEFTSGAMEPVH